MESFQIIDMAGSSDHLNLQKKKIGLSDKDILSIHLDCSFNGQKSPIQKIMDHIEKEILIQTLLKFEGNQRKTAQFLGLKATTLNFKLKKHKIGFLKFTSRDNNEHE